MEALLDFFDPSEGDHDQRSSSEAPVAAPASKTPLFTDLPPEVEVGNIEYKLKLLNPTPSRFEHLVTQMKWRLQEGQGEAIYEIGVADNGFLRGLNESEMDDSIATLKKMANRLGAALTVLRKSVVSHGGEVERRSVTEVLVRKVPDDQQFLDLRLAVLGPMEAGKSTLLGVLTQGELDNGRGKARLNLFRHLHEIQSGRTSSISHEILGFDSKGEVVDYSKCVSAEEICERSSKLITFIDLAGHQKYMKTTIFGLTAHCPDFAMLVVGANSGIVGTTREHLGFCMALQVPTFVVVTKSDLCSSQQMNRTVEQLKQILIGAGCGKIPFRIETESDACTAAQAFANKRSVVAPIFQVSCVTGENLNLLYKFLNAVPPLQSQESLDQQPAEFHVDELFNVPEVGTVLGGILTKGVLKVGDPILVGPNDSGKFCKTKVATLRRNRIPCRMVKAGQAATVTLSFSEHPDFRKGIVLVSPDVPLNSSCNSSWGFVADLCILSSTGTGVKKGFQGTVFVASSKQNADIGDITGKESLSTGESGRVHFKFLRHPEFLRVGSSILFQEGKTRGIGEIKELIFESNENECWKKDEQTSSPTRGWRKHST